MPKIKIGGTRLVEILIAVLLFIFFTIKDPRRV
jgi:hypothetical protein